MSFAARLGRLGWLLLASATVAPGCRQDAAKDAAQQPTTILAAASLTSALREVGAVWSGRSGEELRFSFGPSNALAQQILAGAPADIYLSANQRWADALDSRGEVERRVALLSNRLVWIIPLANEAAIENRSEIVTKAKRVALAGENVPAGAYADQALRATNLSDKLAGRIVRGNDVHSTLAYVERGEADAGVVYATDAASSDRVSLLEEIDPQSYDRIQYPALLLKNASPNARKFFQFLQAPEAREIFARHGFIALPTMAGEKHDAG